MSVTLAEIGSTLSGCTRLLLTAHVAPDADAIGSSCGLACCLQALGKEVTVYFYDEVPARLMPFVSGLTIVHEVPKERFDAVVVLDTATKNRVGKDHETLFACGDTLVNIDHHISNGAWGDINFIDATAASSAQIAYQLAASMSAPIAAQAATLFFAGLCDDTGSFRYSNTDVRALQDAATFVSHGASPKDIADSLYFSVPLNVMQLRAAALSELEMALAGAVAMIVVTDALLATCNATAQDTEGLVDLARSIEGPRVAVFIREFEGKWKVSLRSKLESVDVNAVAGVFGGGGHKMAAGCTVSGSREEVKAAVLAELKKVLDGK